MDYNGITYFELIPKIKGRHLFDMFFKANSSYCPICKKITDFYVTPYGIYFKCSCCGAMFSKMAKLYANKSFTKEG